MLLEQMKKETLYNIIVHLMVLVLSAFLVDAIFFRDINIKFAEEISIEGIFSVLVTIILALYVAHVVEEGREQKQTQNSLLEHIWQCALDSTKDVSDKLELKKFSYLYMIAWPKKMIAYVEKATKIIQNKKGMSEVTSSELASLKEDILSLRNTITSIQPKKTSPDDYLEVKNNEVDAIAPKRREMAMSLASQIQVKVISLWADTIV